ncbi:hypothetical protein AVEN_193075-1 [Araneus ventricosus]|uniref:Uncharacterized protein n=1 Tax=Araneus ventricosus TaxID=182803 RepID=A0A4Y2B2P2_ARAVE|nr:hypothetical protein AVEN_193075-1 [Araneus ventricosus]
MSWLWSSFGPIYQRNCSSMSIAHKMCKIIRLHQRPVLMQYDGCLGTEFVSPHHGQMKWTIVLLESHLRSFQDDTTWHDNPCGVYHAKIHKESSMNLVKPHFGAA